MKTELLLTVLLYSLHSVVHSARILAVLPIHARSHFTISHCILEALGERGHQVTIYSPFIPTSPAKNVKYVEIHTKKEEEMSKTMTFEHFAEMGKESFFGLKGPLAIWGFNYPISEQTLEHPKIKELITSKQKFDLVMLELLFGGESLSVLGHVFNAPIVDISTFGSWSVLNRVHGNALQISSYPEPEAGLSFSNKMDFVQRFRNFGTIMGTLLVYNFDHLPKHQAIIDRVFPGEKFPPLEELLEKLSLSLVNTHLMVNYPIAWSPNMIPIGGIHIQKELDPLPKDVKEFLDSGKNSVIYFSLGSVIPANLMPKKYFETFVKVFSKLPYKVLWKIDLESVPGLPKNVKTSKWLPQESVLAHPNCVLFITHGGVLSQLEAFYHGVPVVGIPFFGDQQYNVRLYEHSGTGTGLDFETLTEESMTKAILSVVGKPEYVVNAKRMSGLMKHTPMSPTDTAVFWVEYVIRHGGAVHLKPAAASMNLPTLFLLDIFAVVFLVLIVAFLLVKAVIKSLCCRQKKKLVPEKKKKN